MFEVILSIETVIEERKQGKIDIRIHKKKTMNKPQNDDLQNINNGYL